MVELYMARITLVRVSFGREYPTQSQCHNHVYGGEGAQHLIGVRGNTMCKRLTADRVSRRNCGIVRGTVRVCRYEQASANAKLRYHVRF